MRRSIGIVVLLAAATAVSSQVSHAQDLPDGVTASMIEDGAKIFRGQGLCHACHGQKGQGMPNLGADLTDDAWLHSDGSIEGIAQTIKVGVPGNKSSVGTSMPPKGGSAISDDQLKAVAAYVWSLSHGDS